VPAMRDEHYIGHCPPRFRRALDPAISHNHVVQQT
jgi:hypothetical protein